MTWSREGFDQSLLREGKRFVVVEELREVVKSR